MLNLAKKDTEGSSTKGVEEESEKERSVDGEEDVAKRDEVAEKGERERQSCTSEGT